MTAPALRLRRPARAGLPLSLTPLVDVLLILVVFFLVTSTYLDLAMVPMVDTAEDAAPGEGSATAEAAPGALLIRLGADGQAYLAGRVLDAAALGAAVAARPGAPVLVLPSPAAPAQALVTVLDAAAAAGARRVQVVRLETAP